MPDSNSKYLVPIVVGVVSAFFANIDRIVSLIDRPPVSKPLQKNWTSIYKDVSKDTKLEEIAIANFSFTLDNNNKIVGVEKTATVSNRVWQTEGNIYEDWVKTSQQGPFILINYKSISTERTRSSVGSIVLEPVTHSTPHHVEEYHGYWIGHEPDLDKIIVCPYVLSSDDSEQGIKGRNKDWLTKPCYK